MPEMRCSDLAGSYNHAEARIQSQCSDQSAAYHHDEWSFSVDSRYNVQNSASLPLHGTLANLK